MSKRYEDEIRDLLNRMERFPGEDAKRRGAPPPTPIRRRAWNPFRGLRAMLTVDPPRLMGGALLMTLGAWVLRGPWSNGFPLLAGIAGIVQLISIVMFVVALVLFMRRGSMSGSPYGGGSGPRWRGQVIELPSRRRPFGGLTNTVSSLWNNLTRRRGAPPSRGRW
ncbi:MAG: hypothetical protein EXR45_07325 [Chloroflexi bacterium]|nr:hypothetical protein [Chloroflexota bacterium]